MNIRDAKPNDAEEILDIFRYYIGNTAVYFSYSAPNIDEIKMKMTSIMRKYPFLVMEEVES